VAGRQPLDDPGHTFTGTRTRPCHPALREKNNYVDLTGFRKIVWRVKGVFPCFDRSSG
jgi:hypothetical protein